MSRKFMLNLDYALIQGAYWGFYIVTGIFVSVYMLGKGYSNTSIGIVIALGNILSVFVQTILANITDRTEKLNDISVIKILLVVMFVLTGGVLLTGTKSMFLTVVYTALIVVHTALHPFVNALSFTLSEGGDHVSFGIGRSMGSLVAAVLGLVMGYMVSDHGVDVILVTGLVLLAVMEAVMLITGRHYRNMCAEAKDSPGNVSGAGGVTAEGGRTGCEDTEGIADVAGCADDVQIGFGEFISANKVFMLLSAGVMALFFGNVILENFTIQIVDSIGGDTEQMGMVVFVMAILEMPAMLFFDKLRRRFSYILLLRVSAVFFAIKIIMIWLAPSMTFIYLAQVNQVLGYGLMFPAMVGFIDDIMSKGEAVRGQAVFTTAITVGNVLGCVFGGRILDIASVRTLLFISSLITAAGTLVICAAVNRVKHRN